MPCGANRANQPQKAGSIRQNDAEIDQQINQVFLIQEVDGKNDNPHKGCKCQSDNSVIDSFGSSGVLEPAGYLAGWQAKSAHTWRKPSNIGTPQVHADVALGNRHGDEKGAIDDECDNADCP